MATSLLALLDDLTVLLDDVAVLTKVAAKKTAGVLGDDLALNAQQVAGVHAARELPVVWAVAKGSAVNKAVLVPVALALSTFAPGLVTPVLVVGGLYLCFEGAEKLAHRWLHAGDEAEEEARRSLTDPEVDLVAFEREKIRGAIRTDFILSAEIIVITLGSVTQAPFATRVAVLVASSVLMTAGVYGFVAAIVKLDDLGLALRAREGAGAKALGGALLALAPRLMKALSVLGTAAMFLVGGGIVSHGVPFVDHLVKRVTGRGEGLTPVMAALRGVGTTLLDGLVGVLTGALVLAVVLAVKRVRGAAKPAPEAPPGG